MTVSLHCQRSLQQKNVTFRAASLTTSRVVPTSRSFSIHSSPLLLRAQFRQASTATTSDRANPPASTRPPFIDTPKRGSESLPAYLWKLARTYGSFYKTGVKAIFSNRKLAKEVRVRLQKSTGVEQPYDFGDGTLLLAAVKAGKINRSDYQLLKRNAHDMMRVPVFGVLVLLLGEWIPLFIPFFPYLPPLTCRIPGQITSMRTKTEERRRWSFRQGVQEPGYDGDRLKKQPPLGIADPAQAQRMVQDLKQDQLYHLSCVLNLHSLIFERLQTAPPTTMMRRRLVRKLAYLGQDDLLLLNAGSAKALASDELLIACEERGLDVLGPGEDRLRSQLDSWLKRQDKDRRSGQSMLHMLFRRPTAWK